MRRGRPREIDERFAHYCTASKERWANTRPTLFLLQGLSEIGGILELQVPESQRETPTGLGLNIHNDKEFSP